MKLKSSTLQLLAGVAALSTVASADQVPVPRAPQPEAPKAPVEKKVDLEALFAMADANQDGKVSYAEFRKAYANLERAILASRLQPVRPQPFIDDCPWCGQG